MLYWKQSPNRIFFLNEYWIFIPTALIVNYLIIRYLRSQRKKDEELKKLKEQIEYLKKIERMQKMKRIFHVANGLDGFPSTRGGADAVIDVSHLNCNMVEGLSYLDNDRLRKIIHALYSNKRRGKLIYITASAVCHLSRNYGKDFLALPIAVGDFGLTNFYQTLRKAFVVIVFSYAGHKFYAQTAQAMIRGSIASVLALGAALLDLDYIPTSSIPEIGFASQLKQRIPDLPDVVVINNKQKLLMTNPDEVECMLPDQTLFNKNCEPPLLDDHRHTSLTDLAYDEIVNMQDITDLTGEKFGDIADMGRSPRRVTAEETKAAVAKFLDKYGDGYVDKAEEWGPSPYLGPKKEKFKDVIDIIDF